jgi:pimeloyl-ACP methyl ester carboxylesterase
VEPCKHGTSGTLGFVDPKLLFPQTFFMRVLLRDGRNLSFREYGLGSGFPIIFTHGNLNSSKYMPSWAKTQAQTEAAGARLIAVDRPGVGGSSIHTGRSYSSWAQDCDELATHLGLEKYAVLGYSSGGPHAIACASANLNDRITALGLFCSDAPYADPALALEAWHAPAGTIIDLAWGMANAQINANTLRESYKAMKDEERRAMALADLDLAIEQGFEGPGSDCVLETSPSCWGFDLGDIKVKTILWHGEDDVDVPVKAGRFLAAQIGKSGQIGVISHFIAGENHSIIRRKWQEALSAVISLSTQ